MCYGISRSNDKVDTTEHLDRTTKSALTVVTSAWTAGRGATRFLALSYLRALLLAPQVWPFSPMHAYLGSHRAKIFEGLIEPLHDALRLFVGDTPEVLERVRFGS